MKHSELEDFKKLLDSVCAMLSRGKYVPDDTSTAIFFNTLRAYDLQTVKVAFGAHCADPDRGRFSPTPADILAKIEGAASNDGRPEPDEAWAIAIKAADEQGSLLWTAEIAEAWGVCKPVWDCGDEIGARMAFKAAYARLVTDARSQRQLPKWSASLGSDTAAHDEVLRVGVNSGRLPASYLPLPAPEVVGLLELAKSERCPPEAKKRLADLCAEMRARADAPSRDALEKQATDARKREAARLVAERLAAGGDQCAA